MPKIVVMGNHDYPYIAHCHKLMNNLAVDKNTKPDFVRGSLNEYWKDVDYWKNSKVLSEYASKLMVDSKNSKRFQLEENSEFGKIVYVHASIYEPENDEDSLGHYQLWTYMHSFFRVDQEAITGTFDMMKDPSDLYWIMFRGHDQGQRVYSQDKDSPLLTRYTRVEDLLAEKVEARLSPSQVHIVSSGSYALDQYGIFDDKTFLLEMFNPGRRELNASLRASSY
jgi:hypothetical protein